jgi:hypothetical protein
MKNKITIVVKSGMVQQVLAADRNVEVEVLDLDSNDDVEESDNLALRVETACERDFLVYP